MTKLYRIVWYEGAIKRTGMPTHDKQALEAWVEQSNKEYFFPDHKVEEVDNDKEH